MRILRKGEHNPARGSLLLHMLAITVAGSIVLGGLLRDPANADESFYKGKTLRVVVGYGSGGGYDLYGRIYAEFIGRFIPGEPAVVVQNMPGAGSFVAAKYLHSVAPKDGTYVGIIAQTFALDAAMNPTDAEFDAARLPVVGRITESVDVGIGRPGAWFKSIEDARQREVVVAATGGASLGFLMPAAVAKFGGARFKLVSGYAGSAEAELAFQRGEADLAASVALVSIQQKYPDWLVDRKAPILYVTGLKRSPVIPWVPTLPEIGQSDLGAKVLTTIASTAEIGKSIVTTPGISAERLAMLRKAMQTMMRDKGFIESMAQRGIPVDGETGERIESVVLATRQTPKEVIEQLRALVTR